MLILKIFLLGDFITASSIPTDLSEHGYYIQGTRKMHILYMEETNSVSIFDLRSLTARYQNLYVYSCC